VLGDLDLLERRPQIGEQHRRIRRLDLGATPAQQVQQFARRMLPQAARQPSRLLPVRPLEDVGERDAVGLPELVGKIADEHARHGVILAREARQLSDGMRMTETVRDATAQGERVGRGGASASELVAGAV
jgi:hypothetical protein